MSVTVWMFLHKGYGWKFDYFIWNKAFFSGALHLLWTYIPPWIITHAHTHTNTFKSKLWFYRSSHIKQKPFKKQAAFTLFLRGWIISFSDHILLHKWECYLEVFIALDFVKWVTFSIHCRHHYWWCMPDSIIYQKHITNGH